MGCIGFNFDHHILHSVAHLPSLRLRRRLQEPRQAPHKEGANTVATSARRNQTEPLPQFNVQRLLPLEKTPLRNHFGRFQRVLVLLSVVLDDIFTGELRLHVGSQADGRREQDRAIQ